MAKWKAQFKTWEKLLKDTEDHSAAAQCVDEIKQAIDAQQSKNAKEARAEISCKVLMLVCSAPNVTAGTELFTFLSRYMYDSYWEKFAEAYKYFLSWLIDKKHWKQVKELLPLIDRCPITLKTLNNVFYVYTNTYVFSILSKQLPETDFKICCKHICKTLKAAHEIDTNEFLRLVDELLAKNRNFQVILMKNWDGADLCLNYIVKLMSECASIENADSFNAKNMIHCLTMINVDTKSKTQYTLLFLKAWVMALQASEIKSDVTEQILTKLYLMIKALRDENVISADGINALGKIAQQLKSLSNDDPWRIYGCVIVSHFLTCRYVGFSKSLEKDCIRVLHLSLDVLATMAEDIEYPAELKLCLECGNVAAHLKWGLALLVTITFSKALQHKVADERLGKLFVKTLESAVKIQRERKCTRLTYKMQSACFEGCSIIRSCVSTREYVDSAYSALETLRTVKDDCNYLKDAQLSYFYKHLFKLKKRYRAALEMQCLYIVHMLDNPRKDAPILDEIASCCSNYVEAQVDFESTICDILDQANFDELRIPSYDRKQVKMLQLRAAMKYSGIDNQLKSSLARKMIIDTGNEVELAEIVAIIGGLSTAELEPKVNLFIQRLKRQIAAKNSKDPNLCLSLARLYSRQYKFELERVKQDAEKKPFTEATLPDVNLDKLKKYDICAENAILKTMIAAKQSFQSFYKRADFTLKTCDFSQIVDEISLLARHFTLRGYMDSAYECWLLVYKIAEKLNLMFEKIRAISFFAEYSDIIQHIDDAIDINDATNSISEDLLHSYQELDKHSPRKQNYILLTIINMALHLLRQKEYEDAHALVELVRDARRKMQNRENCADLVSIKLLAFNFKMISVDCVQVDVDTSPNAYFHQIVDELSRMRQITSEDSINLPAFLFGFLNELTAFTMCRLCASPTRPSLYSVLYYVADFALGFRMAQIVSLLAAIDLQMEHENNYCHKLAVLDTLLDRIPQITLKLPKSESAQLPSMAEVSNTYDLAIESFRRMPVSPKNIRTPFLASDRVMSTEYLPEHPSRHKCSICENTMFRMISFQVGGFIGRNYFATGDYLSSEACLLQALNWWRAKLKSSPMLEYMWFDSIFWMLVAYLNACRQLNLYSKASQSVTEIRDFLRKYEKDSYPSYAHILAEAELCIADFDTRKVARQLALC